MEPTEATSSSPLEATSAREWKQGLKVESFPVTVPSGNTAMVKKIHIEEFLRSGWIPNPLIPAIEDMMKRGGGEKAVKSVSDKAMQKVENIRAVRRMVDRVVVECTVEPNVHPEPPCLSCFGMPEDPGHDGTDVMREGEVFLEAHKFVSAPRDEDFLYVDEVDWADKFAVYDFALSEAAQPIPFREEQEGDVEPVSDSESVPHKTKRPARSK